MKFKKGDLVEVNGQISIVLDGPKQKSYKERVKERWSKRSYYLIFVNQAKIVFGYDHDQSHRKFLFAYYQNWDSYSREEECS